MRHAEDLATDYGMETREEYFDYIVQSLINGQREQVRSLFRRMHPYSQKVFLNNYLEDDNSYQTSTRKVCIDELIKD